jgi:hypothetical protein
MYPLDNADIKKKFSAYYFLKVLLNHYSKGKKSKRSDKTVEIKVPDPDPYLWLMDPDPDPGGPKTRGSGSGSATLGVCNTK